MSLIVVAGAIANKPFNGGEAWVRLSWALGLKRLCSRVVLVEQINAPQNDAPPGTSEADARARQIRYFDDVVTRFGLQNHAALIDAQGECVWGLSNTELRAVAHGADVLINISGNLTCNSLKESIRTCVYVDLDPGFTQFWRHDGNNGARLDGHEFYFTVGENVGDDDCTIPTNGLTWHSVRQPVVLDEWPLFENTAFDRFTTIGSWRGSFGPVRVGDRVYGQKVHEHRKFMALPRMVSQCFELALDIHPSEERDLELLQQNGWQLVDPRTVAGDPHSFRDYVRHSGAEFSVAQGMYVATKSGWFSDRTVRYLAAGKPALVQDTGFSRNLPVGEGLLAFSTLDDAVAGAEAIAKGYGDHCRAARRIAERYFQSDRVLGELLDLIGVRSPIEAV